MVNRETRRPALVAQARRKRIALILLSVLMALSFAAHFRTAFAAEPFPFEEITVDELLGGYRTGRYTTEEVVKAHLDRIAKYEPFYNAFTMLNPNALAEARENPWAGWRAFPSSSRNRWTWRDSPRRWDGRRSARRRAALN